MALNEAKRDEGNHKRRKNEKEKFFQIFAHHFPIFSSLYFVYSFGSRLTDRLLSEC
jgi:hypothetical protein